MNRLTAVLGLCLLCFGFFGFANAQSAGSEKLLRALLDLPAPPPIKNEARERFKERSEEFFFKKNQPPDDAPVEDLFDYWERHQSRVGFLGAISPSENALRRMMAAAESDPEKLTKFIAYLPETPEAVGFVRRMLAESAAKIGVGGQEAAKSWLRYHSDANLDELLQAAQKSKDRKNGAARGEDELRALAAVDWDAARPILERLANDTSQIRSWVNAKRILYEHALKTNDASETERLRGELQATIENQNLPVRARDAALDALILNADWQGREDWFANLLADPTMLKLQDESGVYTGLTTPMLHDPQKWKPLMLRLLANNPNRTVRNALARNLAVLAGDEADEEAMRALLPWLADPKWADDAQNDRARFIAGLARVNLPESVPGLIQVVMTEQNPNLRAAVAALAKYKDQRAVPALRLALEKEPSEYNRNVYIAALVACSGFSDDEQVAALEAFAARANQTDEAIKAAYNQVAETAALESLQNLDAETRAALVNRAATVMRELPPETIQVSIGRVLSQQTEASDSLVLRLLERIDVLERDNPALAATLNRIAEKWQSRNIDAWMLRRVKAGKADAETVVMILARRDAVRERIGNEFGILLGANGAAGALATVLLGDAAEMSRILARAEDSEAQIALLAAARLVRAELPVDAVAALLDDKNKLLALAAERYLEAEDSQRARAFVYAKHPNQALILGARDSFKPAKNVFIFEALAELFASVNGARFVPQERAEMQKSEDELRKELLENADLKEVYAFLPDADSGQRIVRVYADKIVFAVYDDPARYRERTLTADELRRVQSSYYANRITDLAPVINQRSQSEGCPPQSFVALNRNGGRRTFALSCYDATPLDELNELFGEFATAKMTTRYKLTDKIPQLEIVLADEQHRAKAVWKNGDDLRALIERKDETATSDDAPNLHQIELMNDYEEDEDDEPNEKQLEDARRREAQIEFQREQTERYANLAWRKVAQNQLGETVAQPTEAPYLPDATKMPETLGFNFPEPSWQVRAGADEIRTGDEERGGLWRLSRTRAPVQIKTGTYGYLLVTPDSKWLITTKQKSVDDATKSLVRINLQTNKETVVNLPPTVGAFYPIAFVAAHNKVLIARGKSYDSPKEYYLVAPETGAAALVKGDFRPLDEQDFRPLQTAKSQPNALWTAVYNEKTKTTEFGLYDATKFAFNPLLKLPGIKFRSIDTWVDEAERKLYFVYEGQVLSIPLTLGDKP